MAATAGLSLSALLVGCGGTSSEPQLTAQTSLPASSGPKSLGVIEIELTDKGNGEVTSQLSWLGGPEGGGSGAASASGGDRMKALASPSRQDGYLDTLVVSSGAGSVGAVGTGTRYFWFNLKVRNARGDCGSPGNCPAYTTPRKNLTFMAVVFPTSINETAFTRFNKANDTPASPALALQTVPMHGLNSTGTAVDPTRASMQVYRQSEINVIPPESDGVISVLPYGFVVRNTLDGSRTLAANPAPGQYDGTVTLAFGHPRLANTADNPTKINVRLQVIEDADTRVSQSLQEANFAGDKAATARAAAVGATEVATVCTRFAQLVNGMPVCGVRTAGSNPSSPLATMGTAVTTPQVMAAPSNLNNLALNTEVVLGISTPMSAPTPATLVVHGSQSGLRTLAGPYSGTWTGGGSTNRDNQLVFTLGPTDKSFFPGETVSFTATGANSGATGVLPPFVGSFNARGSASGATGAFPGSIFNTSTGGSRAIATGDVNGDNKPDVVVAGGPGSSTAAVLVGDGVGGFTVTSTISLPFNASVRSLKLADVNKDGKLDLVVLDGNNVNALVALGNGDGTFSSFALFGTGAGSGASPQEVAVGDVNGDSNPDLVVVNQIGSFSVLLGNGLGTFGAASVVPVGAGTSPNALALADLNGDQYLDVVVTSVGTASMRVFLGDSSGSYSTSATNYATGNGPSAVVLRDLDNDGKLDAVVLNSSSTSLSVLRGNGLGGFLPSTSFPVNVFNSNVNEGLALGDVDGDGIVDAVVSGGGASGGIAVLKGTGAPGFGAARFYVSRSYARSLALLDANGDGKLDVAVGAGTGLTAGLVIQLNRGSGDFGPTVHPSGESARALAFGDFNGDGKLDTVAIPAFGNNIRVYLGDGAGGMVSSATAGTGSVSSPTAVALGDLNGDGKLDMVVANSGSNSVTALLGDGLGGFAVSGIPLAVGTNPVAVKLADLNGDGNLDIVTANFSGNSVSVADGNGAGGFAAATALGTSALNGPNALAVADLNGDGKLDIVVTNQNTNSYSVMLGIGSGGFAAPTTSALTSFPIGLAVGDVNGDGRPDMVVANLTANTVSVLLGNGSGGFTSFGNLAVGENPYVVRLGDVNGDGRLDIVTVNEASSSSGSVSVLLGDGAGGFTSSRLYLAGQAPRTIELGDINGDGKLDILAANSRIVVMLGL